MLLRWLVDQYLREAGQGKVREVVSELTRSARQQVTKSAGEIISAAEPRTPGTLSMPEPLSPAPEGDFIPCHAAFIFALGIESGGLTDLLKSTENSKHAHGTERAGKLANREVVIVEGGVGQKAAARATAETIKFYQPNWVISAGFSGGLDEKLRRGHIVMADEIVCLTGERIATNLPLDPASFAATKGLHVGPILTVDSIIRQPAERHQLATQHAAIACDMESFAIAATCRDQGIPFMAIRVISDAVDDELPPEIEHLLKQKSLAGKLGAAAGAVFKRFSAAKDLWKLREDALKASDRLAKFLVGIVEQLNTNDQ